MHLTPMYLLQSVIRMIFSPLLISSILKYLFTMKPSVPPQFQVGLLILLFVGAATSVPSRNNETDKLALLAFKSHITDDPFNLFSSWNESSHFCQWPGVICGNRHRRVVVLDLQSQKVGGDISPYVGNLSFLRALHLQNNSFGHLIPPELGRLRRLEILHLHNNSFTGKIPANLSGCSNLVDLDVAYNKLEGHLPAEFGSLSNLRVIHVARNKLGGVIPPSYANLSFLHKFSAAVNNFQGSIPDAFGQLINLKIIGLAENRLSGTIPALIFNLSSITLLDVAGNELKGRLPSDMGNTLPNLQTFSIATNQFTGFIPVSISNASNLFYFAILENELRGGVPFLDKLHKLGRLNIGWNHLGSGQSGDLDFLSSLTNATGLLLLNLSINKFGGTLTEAIGNFSTKLRKILLSSNQISGSIPLGISNLVNLERIIIDNNQFTGNIPFGIGKLQKLKDVSFKGNQLSGNIPSSLGNLSLLIELDLSRNNLHGSIPPNLGNCKNLFSLDLAQNNLSGSIPKPVIGLSSLSYLDLSLNHLTSSLPLEVGNLKNLGYLNISENTLSGEIPAALGSCVSLETLCMEGNLFQGTISPSLSSLKGIQFLDLSRNNLSGRIPEYFEAFDLQNLNLSNNNFSGAIPTKGIFANASVISVMGNSKLCGGVPELGLSVCSPQRSKKWILSLSSKLAISLCCGLLGLTSLLCTLYICCCRKQEDHSGSRQNSLLIVSYQSLFRATDGFSSANLIGTGGFGSVYKGILNETIVAVKVLNLQHRGALKSFMAECEALRNIRHRNLVKIVTACSGVDYQGNDFKALVYDFMVNGSLEEWLHPVENVDELQNKQKKSLDLLQRLNISLDVAYALDYLHHNCQTPIIHCDLKPSNVLLKRDMTAHVGDFGLARFLPEATHNLSRSSIGLRGSIGYTAPEYGMGSEVSTKGDVYSYGILVLEMFTRKRPTDGMFEDGLNLHNLVRFALPYRFAEVVDSVLLEGGGEENTTHNLLNSSSIRGKKFRDCLISILQIGVSCSAELPKERMNITDVVTELRSIRRDFLGTVHTEN